MERVRPVSDASALDVLALDARYLDLVRRRSLLGWSLALTMVTVYFCFLLLVAFAPHWLARSVNGGVISTGIVLGLGVIVVAIALTGVYVRVANRTFDRDVASLLREYRL